MEAVSSRETPQEHAQLRFRRANEALLGAVERSGARAGQPVRFLCECASEDCVESVEASKDEWREVTAQHNHFLMRAGHQHSDGEEVVGHLGEYDITRKPE
jgi:hypothetical protein